MNDYLLVKTLHILSATILFGTGIGTAFYLLVTTLGRDVRVVAAVTRWVVIADWLFTATTAVAQPLTGWWLAHRMGMPLMEVAWLRTSVVLYALAIACWLPVVGLQIRLRDLAAAAARDGTALPPAYWRVFRGWVLLGVPALFAFLAIFWLMVAKPA
ncbi:DUF2269 family protein [Lysobacter humi (ex Lee et al. 2017)]